MLIPPARVLCAQSHVYEFVHWGTTKVNETGIVPRPTRLQVSFSHLFLASAGLLPIPIAAMYDRGFVIDLFASE